MNKTDFENPQGWKYRFFPFAGILLIWFLVHLFLLHYTGGIKVMIDSRRFLSEAGSLLSHGFSVFSSFYSYQYLSYVGLIAIVIRTGGGLEYVIFLQLLFSFFATVALYNSALILSGSRIASLLACLFFLLWVELSSWNFNILTESLYTSCSILCFYLLLKTKNNRLYGIFLVPLILFTIFIRPHGIVLLLSTAIFGFTFFTESLFFKSYKKLVYSVGAIAFSVLVVLTGLALEDFDFMSVRVFATGDIVYGATKFAGEYKMLSVDAGSLIQPDPSQPTAFRIIQFVAQNPWYFIRLSLAKLLIFFAHVKPYYSLLHNLLIVCTLFPLYVFFYKGIITSKRSPSKNFVISLVVLQAISVMLTAEDWDGRFLMPVLPFIMLYAALGITFRKKKIRLYFKCPGGQAE